MRERSNRLDLDPACRDAEPRDWQPLLDRAIEKLPAKFRDVLLLCELQQIGRAEAAKLLNLPLNTLSSRLARAKEMLRAKLAPRELELPAGFVATLAIPSALSAATLERCRQLLAHAGELSQIIPLSIVSLIEGGSTMFVSKCLMALTVALIAGFSVLTSGQMPQKAEPPAERKPVAEVPKAPREKEEPKAEKEQISRLDKLRQEKVEAAKEWLDGLLIRVKLGKDSPTALREPTIALVRAKLELAKTDAEREAVLVEQRKHYEQFKEWTVGMVDAGTVGKHHLAQANVYLLEAEIELELFRESMKKK